MADTENLQIIDPMEFKDRFGGEYTITEAKVGEVLLKGDKFQISIEFIEGNKAVIVTIGKTQRLLKVESVFEVEHTTFEYDVSSNNVFITRNQGELGKVKQISFSLVNPR
jgi:hypothetical protein